MKRFFTSIGISFMVPLACFTLPMVACRPSLLDDWIPMWLCLSFSTTIGFGLAYPVLRIGRDGVVQRRRYLAPLVVALVVVAGFFTSIIPLMANVFLGPIRLHEGIPEFMAGWMGLYVLAGIVAFLTTLLIKLWDVVAT